MNRGASFIQHLGHLSDAYEFFCQFETLQEGWEKCERGDWMLGIAAIPQEFGVLSMEEYRKLVSCRLACAQLRLPWASENAQNAAEKMSKLLEDSTLGKTRLIDCLELAIKGVETYFDYDEEKTYANQAIYHAFYTHGIASSLVVSNVSRSVNREAYFSDGFACLCYDEADAKVHIYEVAEIRRKCAEIVREYYPATPIFLGHSEENWLA